METNHDIIVGLALYTGAGLVVGLCLILLGIRFLRGRHDGFSINGEPLIVFTPLWNMAGAILFGAGIGFLGLIAIKGFPVADIVKHNEKTKTTITKATAQLEAIGQIREIIKGKSFVKTDSTKKDSLETDNIKRVASLVDSLEKGAKGSIGGSKSSKPAMSNLITNDSLLKRLSEYEQKISSEAIKQLEKEL